MASYNKVIMIGNLTRDPDTKQLTSGQSLCRFSLASNRPYKNRQTGAVTQEVCYVDVDVWGQQADACKQYLNKGKSVLVEGRLKLDSWQDPEGNKRSKHSIVADRVTFLSSAAGMHDEDGGGSAEGGSSDETLVPYDQEMIKSSPAMSSVMEQVEKAKKAATTKTKAPGETGGEINFKDQAPFEEELPF